MGRLPWDRWDLLLGPAWQCGRQTSHPIAEASRGIWCSIGTGGKWDYSGGNGIDSILDRFTDPRWIEYRRSGCKTHHLWGELHTAWNNLFGLGNPHPALIWFTPFPSNSPCLPPSSCRRGSVCGCSCVAAPPTASSFHHFVRAPCRARPSLPFDLLAACNRIILYRINNRALECLWRYRFLRWPNACNLNEHRRLLAPKAITRRGQIKPAESILQWKCLHLHFGNSEANTGGAIWRGLAPFLSLGCITVHEPDSVLIHLQWMPLLPCIEKRSVPEKQSSRRLRLLSAPLWVQVNNFSGLQRAVSAPHKKVNMLYASRCFCKSGLYVFWRADISESIWSPVCPACKIWVNSDVPRLNDCNVVEQDIHTCIRKHTEL